MGKPLGGKAYGSIPHFPGSRLGPGDHHCAPGQARIACEKTRDKRDVVGVTEKLDGSACAVARIDGRLHPLGRAGYEAASSPYEQHRLFARWAMSPGVAERFWAVLPYDGLRLVGEWLAQAHGTRYDLPHEPFVAFDLMRGTYRWPYEPFRATVAPLFTLPRLLHLGGPLSIDDALTMLEPSGHGALDPVEGAVWRVERDGEVDFLAKYVRPDKVDGRYLPEVSGGPIMWNDWPDKEALFDESA